MKRKPYPARDLCAQDIYERAMLPYWNLLAEADRERLLKQIRFAGPQKQGLARRLVTALGDGLIATGLWFQKAGKIDTTAEEQFGNVDGGFRGFDDL